MTRALLLILALAACGAPVDEPDAGLVETPDAGELVIDADAGDEPSDPPDAGEECVPPTAEEVCAGRGFECGRLGKRNPCTGEIEEYVCGPCPEGYRCAIGEKCVPN